jgi:hypothetical protein
MSVTVTLRQEKITLSDKFVSVSWITVANPAGYYPLFVFSEGIGGSTDERFDRVATLNDLATYTENPLVRIYSPGAFDGIGATVGDILTIENAPDYWLDSFLTVAKFTVAEVAADYLYIESTVPFPTAKADLDWTLRDSTDTVMRGSGTDAQCSRQDYASSSPFLHRHLTMVFDEVKAASDHVDAISAYVKAVIDDANEDADQFSGVETEVIS